MSKNSSPKEDRHHRICKSRGGDDNPPNNTLMNYNKHHALHTVFDNQHPLEQLVTIVDIAELVLVPEFRVLILDILKIPPQEAYIQEAFKNRKAFEQLFTRNI
jgi:hypothetical protein